MTPDAPPSSDPSPQVRPVRIRRKKRRRGRSRFLRDLWIPGIVVLAAAAILGVRYLSHLSSFGQVAGYIGNSDVLEQEYLYYEGKPLNSLAETQQFRQAFALTGKGDFKGAAQVLEAVSRQCAEPVVFHDIGILYAQMGDRDRALNAFREALARDPNYAPVHLILNSLRGFDPHAADPVTAEVEPNGTSVTANLISMDADVVGEISTEDDVDCYRFSAPPAPRDVLRVEVKIQSMTLAPRITIYDEYGHPTGEALETQNAGSALTLRISPRPNSTRFVEIGGSHQSTGAYALKITAERAFDQYEPNDDIGAARNIVVGRELEANIMTAEDVDFYTFVADRTGKMTVTLRSRSDSLIPGLAVYGPNQQLIQEGANTGEQGRTITRSIGVQETKFYYVQVSGQAKSSGNYILIVQ